MATKQSLKNFNSISSHSRSYTFDGAVTDEGTKVSKERKCLSRVKVSIKVNINCFDKTTVTNIDSKNRIK